MNRKGMSQTLALIVAAMVLMMTALTLIFMTQGTLGDFGQTVSEQGCSGTVDSQCAVKDTNKIQIPASCKSDGQLTKSFKNTYSYDEAENTVRCS